MKKHSLFVTVLLLMFSAAFTSCDSEPVDTQLVDTENTPGTDNNDGSGSDTAGSYWPMAINNQWNYDAGSQGDYDMKITGTENISGTTYYKYDHFIASVSSFPEGLSGTVETYTRKDNNDYKVRVAFEMNTGNGGPALTMAPMEYTLLKDNLAVGQSWTEQIQQTITVTMDGTEQQQATTTIVANGTIMEKSDSAVIDGVTYNDVIKVKYEQLTEGAAEVTSYYWFVKNKGIMKAFNDYTNSNITDITYTVESYIIN